MMATAPSLPAEHDLFPSFVLFDHRGELFDVGAFRQRRNLVLCFIRKTAAAVPLLEGLAAAARELEEAEATVVVVALKNEPEAERMKLEMGIPFPVLADASGDVVGRFCPGEMSVYVTDRFREVFLAMHGPDKVDTGLILQRLRFIEHQCPE